MDYKEIILAECNIIKNENIKQFVELAINNLPDYFFVTAASSSGRYHPDYALGDGGLIRHTLAAVRFAHHLFQLEQFQNQFSEDEQDCVIAAILLHDGWKHGDGNSIHTVHEHPQVCADWVRVNNLFFGIISQEIRELIANGIATHMGQWTTSKKSKIVLEKPTNKIQKFVHMCDYLASRKDIEILFNNAESPEPSNIDDYEISFGKFKGIKIKEAFAQDKSYFEWVMTQEKFPVRDPLKGFIAQLMKGE